MQISQDVYYKTILSNTVPICFSFIETDPWGGGFNSKKYMVKEAKKKFYLNEEKNKNKTWLDGKVRNMEKK